MKHFLLPVLLLVFMVASAQHSSISGKVQDAGGKPVEYANVLLLRANDSSLVKGMLSDAAGAYRFEGLAAGSYTVSANMLGYGKAVSKVLTLAGGSVAVSAETLVLRPAAQNLKEVVVQGQRPFIEQQLDKTVMNVDNSIVAAGNTALEVLEKAPGVTVDQNDNISMRGRQGVIVLIDGKPVPMSGAELASMLRGMSANAVEKIELITNPSAKYDAGGNAGVIDIKLKRDKSQGTNGTLSSSFGQGRYAKSNQGLQLNHRAPKLNLFGNYNYVYRKDFNHLDLYREFFKDNVFTGAYDQQNPFSFSLNNHSARLGADYYLSPRTTIGMSAGGFSSDVNRTNTNRSLVLDAQRRPESSFLTDAVVGHARSNMALNLNLKHTLDSLGRELTADLDYITYRNTDRQDFTTNYYNLQQEQTRSPYLLYGALDGDLTIKAAKADYSQPWKAVGGSLEAGLKSSLVSADNNLAFYDRSKGGNELDRGKSNHFLYEENINAAYLNAAHKGEKMSLQLGLRLENTRANGKQLTDGQTFERDYTQLFPSAFAGYNLSKAHNLGLSLSRRINRPSYNQLNPFKNFLDPSTYAAGNPYLKPELSYAFEASHTFKQRFITKLGYSRTTDVILQVLAPDTTQEKLVAQTFQNLGRLDYYSLTLTLPFSIGNWFNSNNNATFYYGLYSGKLAQTELHKGRPTFNLNSNNTFTFSHGWSAELTAVYRGSEVYGFLEINPIWFASGGVQKQFWDKKASVKLNVSDAFFTNKVRGKTALTGYTENFYQRRDTRVATLSFTYRFGRAQAAPSRRRSGSAEEEKSRAGGN